MKSFIPIFFLLIVKISIADTLDHWVVYQNEKVIKKLSQKNDTTKIILKLGTDQLYDTLTVKYYSNIPCYKCGSRLIISDNNENYFDLENLNSEKIEEFPLALKFSLQELKNKGQKFDSRYFDIYYLETGTTGWANKPKQYLFRLKLE